MAFRGKTDGTAPASGIYVFLPGLDAVWHCPEYRFSPCPWHCCLLCPTGPPLGVRTQFPAVSRPGMCSLEAELYRVFPSTVRIPS